MDSKLKCELNLILLISQGNLTLRHFEFLLCTCSPVVFSNLLSLIDIFHNIFQELGVVKLAKRINRIVQSRISRTNSPIQLIDRVMDEVRTGDHIILQIINLLKQRLIIGQPPVLLAGL